MVTKHKDETGLDSSTRQPHPHATRSTSGGSSRRPNDSKPQNVNCVTRSPPLGRQATRGRRSVPRSVCRNRLPRNGSARAPEPTELRVTVTEKAAAPTK
ncbi:hypothetical protein [Flexivirga alba]|uniref:Uncharacterized protein n=1 Tax=Flexivirga alba TaxID=702742 RepID=A0ABW2AJ63_9MICO